MTNSEILNIAMQQSAYDLNCKPDDFLKEENIVTVSKSNPKARKYLELPFECNLVSYGNNIVASIQDNLREIVSDYINKYPSYCCYETPNIQILDDKLRPHNLKLCFMAEFYLPDINSLKTLDCDYELRVLHSRDFNYLYTPQWSNALCFDRKHLDILGIGAYENDRLIGLAGCSADCDTMWQIGVDVLPEYRRQGIASALTSRLALKILDLNKVPFYCAAWSNIKSSRNAIKSGFRPAWTELTAKSMDFIAKM